MMNKPLLKSTSSNVLTLEAVLLNVNLRSVIPREAIVPASLRRYQNCIAAGEATIRLPSGEYRLAVDFKAGNALLHLWRGQMPMSIAASELWQFLVDVNPESARLPEPEEPRALPWLALNFLPEFVASADTRLFRQLSALHWALAWAVVEHTLTQQRRN
jgi:hypothetical protein